ncbi:MAG: glycosyltransferase family 9 protein [Bacteroidales bacterium]|nr:glycosyltransferase family 9 protein [Bacteroidales bacterium]
MRILIIRLGSTGDILLTTPVIRAISQQIEGAKIHFLTNRKNKELLASNPHVEKIHVYQEPVKALVDELKAEQFDFIVDLQHNRRTKHLCSRLNLPCSFLKTHPFKRWMCIRLKINTLPHKHLVERYFETVEAIGIQNDCHGLEYPIPAEDVFDTDDLPVFFEDGYVAIAMDAERATQRIPTTKIIEIATILHKPVILLGGKEVKDMGQEIVSQLGDRAYNACGEFSFNQCASLIQQSACVLTGDSAFMHLATALNKPVCSLWGSTVPEFGKYPYLPEQRQLFRIFEVCSLKCRPCAQLGFKKCPRRHFRCMKNIPAIEVAEWINQF